MKAHLAKLSLALLSAAFMLGCQEQGSGPVGPGPEFHHRDGHSKGGGGDGDPDPVTFDLADGMQATGLPAGVGKDTRKTLKFGNHNQTKQTIDMNFTELFPGDGKCVGFAGTNGGVVPDDDEVARLAEELTQDAPDAKVVVGINKTESSGTLIVEYDDEELGLTRIQLGSPFNQVDPVTVVESPKDVFTFTGPVVVWKAGGGIDNQRVMYCPGDGDDPNKVVVTLNR